MNKVIICDDLKPLEVAKLCEKYNLGIEVQSFYLPFDDNKKLLDHKIILKNISLKSMHGPFGDLCPGSFDPLVKDTALNRFNYAYNIAQELNIEHIIFHNGYFPKTSSPKKYVERSILFWNDFLKNKNNSINYHIENLFENDPIMLNDLIDGIKNDKVNINLDVGHLNCNTDCKITDWIKILNKKIGYFHLHDNNGKFDEHLAIGNGNMNFDEIINFIFEFCPDAYIAIETDFNNDLEYSVNKILEYLK